jgi:dephospho-CoA kinase
VPGIFTVVLTGGIGSGKTAASDHFESLGVPVVDTDVIAKQIVEPGQPALGEIARQLGERFIDKSGRLDRKAVRSAIFSDPDKKARLEAILHPRIALEVQRRISALDYPYCILVIPLFTESGRYDWVDRVLVVDVDESVQLERVTGRDQVSRQQARAILDAQASRNERLALADDVLDNSGSLAEMHAQIDRLHTEYLRLAGDGN